MYKKLLPLLAIFAGFGTLSTTPALAKEVKNGIEYWTVPEMYDFMLQADVEAEAACGTSTECQEEFFRERYRANGQYRALESFERERFILSSINPVAERLTLFYQDKDREMARMLGNTEPRSITDFYMLWVESWLGNPIKKGSWLTYGQRYPYYLGSQESVELASHLMIDESQDTMGADWFTPNVEREYLVTGSGLKDNTVQMLYYSLLESTGGRTKGVKDYTSCFDGTDYEDGMECKFMFGADGSSRYFPFGSAAPTTPPTTSTDDDTATNGTSETDTIPETTDGDRGDATSDKNADNTTDGAIDSDTNNAMNDTTNTTDSTMVVASVASAKPNDQMLLAKPVIIQVETDGQTQSQNSAVTATSTADPTSTELSESAKLPLSTTGIELPKSGDCEKEIIFPWWFIILVLLCDAIIMWFFWPKKSEKGVDKRVNLR